MVERRSCPGKIGCKLKTKGRHSRLSPYALPLGFSCKEEDLYLGRVFASTPACIGINSDLGFRGVLTGADSGCADLASTVDVSAGIPVVSRLYDRRPEIVFGTTCVSRS